MVNLELIIAIAGSSIAIVGVVIAMMFWVRGESNILRSDAKLDRENHFQAMKAMDTEMKSIIKAIELEMKDFHYKLLEIERSRK